MKTFKPIPITTAMVALSSAIDPDPPYNPIETCAKDALRTYGDNVYVSLQAGNIGKVPGTVDGQGWWSLVGVKNSRAMFDRKVKTQTTATDSLSVTIAASYISGLSLHNIKGKTVSVTMVKESETIFYREVDLWNWRIITDFADLLLAEPEFSLEKAFTDLPPIPDVLITITITSPGNTVAIGLLAMGRVINAGLDQFKIKVGVINYTQATFDRFENLTESTDAKSKYMSAVAIIPNLIYEVISNKLTTISSTEVVCIGGNGLFDSLIMYGLLTITLELQCETESHVSFEMKGLI